MKKAAQKTILIEVAAFIVAISLTVGGYLAFYFLDSSEQPSEQASEEPSQEPSEQPSDEPSQESSEQPSDEPSQESSEQSSEQPSEEIYQEIMQEFPEHDFAYALYDIQSSKIVTEYNTNTLFRTGCTIKPLYVWYILSEENIDLKDTILLQSKHLHKDPGGLSHISKYCNKNPDCKEDEVKYFVGESKLSIKFIIECCITYSDNTAYKMLTDKYKYSGFNEFMAFKGIQIGLGSAAIGDGSNYTSATAADQLKAWIAISKFMASNSKSANYLGKRLKSTSGIKFAEKVLNQSTFSMAGWAEKTSTFNECYIVENKYIAVVLTSTGKETPIGTDINTKPLETIAVKLHEAWEAYNS